MDPNVTVQEMIEAVLDDEMSVLHERATSLIHWIKMGGFMPTAPHNPIKFAMAMRDLAEQNGGA